MSATHDRYLTDFLNDILDSAPPDAHPAIVDRIRHSLILHVVTYDPAKKKCKVEEISPNGRLTTLTYRFTSSTAHQECDVVLP